MSTARLANVTDLEGYLPLAPDLVAEVVLPHDTFTQVEEKALFWLDSGTKMVLVVDPGTRTVHVYHDKGNIVVLHDGDSLDAGDVLTEWMMAIGDLFD